MDLQQEQCWADAQNDENADILYVRTEAEVSEGAIPNASHHSIYQGQDCLSALENLDKSKNYYVYCRSGNRSGQTCLLMNQLGFQNTFNLVPGMNDWEGPTE